MNRLLKEKILESLSAVLPVTFIVLAISVVFVPVDAGAVLLFLLGAVLLVVGMGFFQLGADMAMTPLGRGIGAHTAQSRRLPLLVLMGFCMGLIITVAEPDLLVLADQVPAVPSRLLIFTVAAGVGIFLAAAMLRIVLQLRLSVMLIVLYLLLLVLSFFVPRDFLAVAFDAGGVTTGPMTVPFIMAMGVGLAAVRGDRAAADDSFGLVALSSVGPVLAVLLLGIFFRPAQSAYTAAGIAEVHTTQEAAWAFVRQLPHYAREVLFSLLPVLAMFVLFQLRTRRYHPTQRLRMLIGFAYTGIGLILFLCGANIGFSPVGTLLGAQLAASRWRWLLVPLGMLIGYYIVKAEPAIQVLNRQVQEVTNGAVSARSMNRCMSVGVSVSVGLAILRVLTGLSIHWIIIPGYLAALALSTVTPPIFVGIAFDSGGVASGPMTTTFLLPLSIGACEALGGSIMTDAFGVVALVALTPLIAVQLMGLQYRFRQARIDRAAAAAREAALADCDEIVDLGEED